MPNTDKHSLIDQAIVDKLNLNKVALGIADVWYGDQALIPRTPTVTVEGGPISKNLTNMGFSTTNDIFVYLMVYLGKVQDVQLNKKQADQLTEAIIDLMHVDKQLGGLVVVGHCAAVDPGFTQRRDALLKVNRITWAAKSKTTI